MMTHLRNVIAAVLKKSFLFYKSFVHSKKKKQIFTEPFYTSKETCREILKYCRDLK